MINTVKQWIKRRWPRMRLRTIVFATLFTVAALPGIAAMFLRVYENTLVRQTEAELVAQGAALVAAAEAAWPGGSPAAIAQGDFRPEASTIDLSESDILDDRPAPDMADSPSSQASAETARNLAPVFARTKQVTLSSIMLLDAKGRIASGPMAGASHANVPEIRAALLGRPMTVLRNNASYAAQYRLEWASRAAGIRIHHARPIMSGGEVVGVLLLSRSARSLFKGIYADRGKIALGILAIFGILVVLSGVLSRGIVRPIEGLSRATRSLASGGQDIPSTPPTAAIEIQDLYADFARMATAIDLRSRYLRDFAHAMSHEFKTPLTGIRGALEILADHGDTMEEDERRRFLANADADAERLTLLVTRLLELARADMSATAPKAPADLADIMQRLSDAYGDDNFRIRWELAAGFPPLAMPEGSLDAVLSTFITNSRLAGASQLALTGSAEADGITIRITDNGSGIAPGNREQIFEPFFTTHRESGGSGLGLAIARSLITAAGGTLDLEDSGQGTAFVIELPSGTARRD